MQNATLNRMMETAAYIMVFSLPVALAILLYAWCSDIRVLVAGGIIGTIWVIYLDSAW